MQPSENPLVRARTLEERSPYNRVIALILWWFLGIFGGHRFYVGKWLSGILMLLTGGGFFIWWIIDFFVLITGRFRDANGRVLGPPQIQYEQLPEPKRKKNKRPKQLTSEPVEPELAPLKEPDFDIDDEVMRDPLEDKFAELEKEFDGTP